MSATENILIEKIRQRPPTRLAELEDFIDFLRSRDDDRRLTLAATRAAEAGFAAVWDNDDDAAHDRM